MRLTLSKLPGHINRIVDKVAPQSVEVSASAEPSGVDSSAAQPTAVRQASSPQLQPTGPQSPQAAAASSGMSGPYGSLSDKECQRLAKFDRILSAEVVDLTALRDASWSGIPTQHRMTAWQQLLGYLPANREWREASLQRKRREYSESVPRYFDIDDSERSEYQRALFHQVRAGAERRRRGRHACALATLKDTRQALFGIVHVRLSSPCARSRGLSRLPAYAPSR